MKNDLFFEASDGWLFASIMMSCMFYGKVKLGKIILTGDTINHAIFSLSQINDGLSRLESEGFVERRGTNIFVTKKTKQFAKAHKKHFELCIDEQVRYQRLFKTMPLTHKTIYREYFSKEEYKNILRKKYSDWFAV